MAAVLAFVAGRRGGKSALAWHLLKQESSAAGLPIECVRCEKPHAVPPLFGRCVCGSMAFGVKRPERAQPSLDFHAGEA